MAALVLEVLSLVTIPLGLLVLAVALVLLLAERRWIATTAYLEEGPPQSLHWISEDGEVGSRKLTPGDPLSPKKGDQRTVFYSEDDPAEIRVHRRGDPVRALRLTGLLVLGFGIICAVVSTALTIFGS
ncbi:MAG: hypothetical protein ABWZ77_03615 [Naasia sp.]